jgi:hypothetical protein
MSAVVVVCRKCEDHDCLARYLRRKTDARVDEVRCQKICHGPVAGIEVDGRMEWFERVSTRKAMVGLKRVVDGKREVAGALKKRRVKKHYGRAPR